MTYFVIQVQQRVFNGGFFAAESDSEAEAWWQNGHTCGRAKCNAGIFSPLSQAPLTILTWFAAVCLMQSAEVCGGASYCCSCLTDCSMVVISKGMSHRCVF